MFEADFLCNEILMNKLPLVKSIKKEGSNWLDETLGVCVDFQEDHGKVFNTSDRSYVRDTTPEELETALAKREFAAYLVYVEPISIERIKRDPEWQYLSGISKAIIREHLDGMKKVIGSPTVYLNLHGKTPYVMKGSGEQKFMTMQDVEDAYNICYGDGCEYEWPYG